MTVRFIQLSKKEHDREYIEIRQWWVDNPKSLTGYLSMRLVLIKESNPDIRITNLIKVGDYWYRYGTISEFEFSSEDEEIRFLLTAGLNQSWIGTNRNIELESKNILLSI